MQLTIIISLSLFLHHCCAALIAKIARCHWRAFWIWIFILFFFTWKKKRKSQFLIYFCFVCVFYILVAMWSVCVFGKEKYKLTLAIIRFRRNAIVACKWRRIFAVGKEGAKQCRNCIFVVKATQQWWRQQQQLYHIPRNVMNGWFYLPWVCACAGAYSSSFYFIWQQLKYQKMGTAQTK